MHYSSILVTARPRDIPACLDALQALPGVQVHLRYPEKGRIIVTQESPSLAGQEEGLRAIQAIPGVFSAALVLHYIDTESGDAEPGESAAGPGNIEAT